MKKVLLILQDDSRSITTFPAVCNCANELKKRGFYVEILTRSIKDIDEVVFDKYTYLDFKQHRIFNKQGICFVGEIINIFKMFFILKHYKCYKYIICFEPKDAIFASLAAFFYKNKYIYFNLEILEKSQLKSAKSKFKFYIFKFFEKLFNKNSACLVIQDKIRKKISAKYGIENPNTFYIPNSYYNHIDKSKVQEKPKGLIYIGGLEKWAIEPIVKNLIVFKDIDLTMSGWSRDNYLFSVEEKLLDNNIKIIKQKLDTRNLIPFIKKYAIGLVLYSADCDNVYYMGRSSGKFFLYLSCGIPVIVIDLPGISEDVRKYNLGVVIHDMNELPGAIQIVNRNYKYFSSNVRYVFKKYFEYSKASKSFFDLL